MADTEQAPSPWPPWPRPFHYVYAAKFLCGDLKPSGREGPVEPGSYTTAINIHKPHVHPLAIRKKATGLAHLRADLDYRIPNEVVATWHDGQAAYRWPPEVSTQAGSIATTSHTDARRCLTLPRQ